MSAGGKSFSTLATALVLFGLAGCAVAATVPRLFAGPEAPGSAVFLVAGLATVVLTAVLFGCVDRLGMGFGRTALVLAAGYNALIATVKLGLAPSAMYEANREQSFDAALSDPNSPAFYVGVGATVLLLYLLVFSGVYLFFRRRLRGKFRWRESMARNAARGEGTASGTASGDADPSEGAGEGRRIGPLAGTGMLVAVVALVALSVLGFALWWVPVLFVGLPTLSYLSYVFATLGVAVALALLLAAVLAYGTFERVERRAVHLGDATLLAGFFWLGFALILLYHAMWAVFMLTLVSIWPFQTYTPK